MHSLFSNSAAVVALLACSSLVADEKQTLFERLIAVAHPPGRDAVVPAVAGSLVLEQRGPALTVFGPP